jgi:drug/metabolite transporter (DMT)-like permease
MSEKRRRITGYSLAALSAIAFSIKGILAKMLFGQGLDPVTVLAIRFAIATPLFWVIIAIMPSERVGKRDAFILVLSGLVGLYLAALADFYGLRHIDATLERVILYTYPAFVVILARVFFKEAIGSIKGISLLLTYAGLLLVLKVWTAGLESAYFIGGLLVLFSAIIYSGSYIITESIGKRVSGLRISAYTVTAATVAFLATWVMAGVHAPMDANTWGLLAVLGVISTFVPALALAISIRMIGASRAALFSFIGPLLTALLANILLGEKMDNIQASGMALIMLGVILITLRGVSLKRLFGKNG